MLLFYTYLQKVPDEIKIVKDSMLEPLWRYIGINFEGEALYNRIECGWRRQSE